MAAPPPPLPFDTFAMPPPPQVPGLNLYEATRHTGLPPIPPPVTADHARDRSRSHSRTPSEERSASEAGETENEEDEHGLGPWRPIVEDKSAPCDDEMAYIHSREERSALDHEYWARDAFFDLDDESFEAPVGEGRIDWLVEHFNGTKENPNREGVMRSPTVTIGGYDWRIKLFPRGNSTEFISVYLECVSMQSPEWQEYEGFDSPPFPMLKDGDNAKIKKLRTVAAQVSVVLYNPAEPRTHEHKADAHRFSKRSADYGWRYFAHREDFYMRRHGQRQALLRDDKLAFSAYIRVVNDPTGCMWEHGGSSMFDDCVSSTGLRPFAGQTPHLAAVIPLLHFKPFRDFVMSQTESTTIVHGMQTILWKLFSRTHSSAYGQRTENEIADAASWMRRLCRTLHSECDDAARITSLLGSMQPDDGAPINSNRLRTKDCKNVQEAIDKHPSPMPTPPLLILELERQEFDRAARKWAKLTNKVEMDYCVRIGKTGYTLYAFVTHTGDLQSNKHNSYVRPGLAKSNWYAYQDCRVTAMTQKQAVDAHEGFDKCDGQQEKRRTSPFGFLGQVDPEDEVAYLVMYVRNDYISQCHEMPKYEDWLVPEAAKAGMPLPQDQASTKVVELKAELPFREEQERFEQELERRERELEAQGSATPDWPMTDEQGDVVMSDVEDDESSQPSRPGTAMVESTSLMAVKEPRSPSSTHKWYNTIDALGRDYYQGQMLGDKYQGEGHLITMAGDEYTGSFYNGLYEGHGKMVYASTGHTYEGEWCKGQQHGHGKLTEASTGNVYEGGWEFGKKHGKFTLQGTVTDEDKGQCTICYDKEITTAFYDCGHVVACKDCANKIDNCPVCRRRVVGRLQLYGIKMTLE